jgi:hypothetical protein
MRNRVLKSMPLRGSVFHAVLTPCSRDTNRGKLDETLVFLEQHHDSADGNVLYAVACLPLMKRLVEGAYNQLSYLTESYLPRHTLGEPPWQYMPSLLLMKVILNDPELFTIAKTLGDELGESLMTHLQDVGLEASLS